MTDSKKPRRVTLFSLHPGENYGGLIVRYPHDTDGRIEYDFADAAERLAASYRGEPSDDAILYPWLFLYRHAIELSLKQSIRLAAGLRRANGERDSSLEAEAVNERLRRKHGHRLGALLSELNEHLEILGVSSLPPKTIEILTALAEADPNGVSFRYAGSFPDTQDAMDFPQLNAAVKEAYGITSATIDVLDVYAQGQADWLDEKHQLEAEMRAEFEHDMWSEYGGDQY